MSVKKTATETAAQNRLNALAATQTKAANFNIGASQNLYNQANKSASQLEHFFSALAGGDRTARAQIFGTELEDLAAQNLETKNRLLTSMPLGGEMNMALANNEMSYGRSRSELLKSAPLLAVEGRQNLMSSLLSGGSSYGGMAAGLYGGAMGADQSILDSEARMREAKMKMWGSLMSAPFEMFGTYLGYKGLGSLTGNKGSSAATSSATKAPDYTGPTKERR